MNGVFKAQTILFSQKIFVCGCGCYCCCFVHLKTLDKWDDINSFGRSQKTTSETATANKNKHTNNNTPTNKRNNSRRKTKRAELIDIESGIGRVIPTYSFRLSATTL